MKDTFQRRFLEAKESSGYSWSEIADKTGLSKPRISQYKNGKYEPTPEALYSLAGVLNVNPAWLMGYDVPKDPNYVDPETSAIMTRQMVNVLRDIGLGRIDPNDTVFAEIDPEDTILIAIRDAFAEMADSMVSLSPAEQALLDAYRAATPEAQMAAMLTLKANRKEQP